MDEERGTDVMDDAAHARDAGVTLVEMLVAIVLLGTAVVAVVAAVLVTITGSRLERDHSRAQQWLQSATEVVRSTPQIGCNNETPTQIADGYEQLIRDALVSPPEWSDQQLAVITDVKVWDGTQYVSQTAPRDCNENEVYMQLITIQVSSPTGEIIESVEVARRD